MRAWMVGERGSRRGNLAACPRRWNGRLRPPEPQGTFRPMALVPALGISTIAAAAALRAGALTRDGALPRRCWWGPRCCSGPAGEARRCWPLFSSPAPWSAGSRWPGTGRPIPTGERRNARQVLANGAAAAAGALLERSLPGSEPGSSAGRWPPPPRIPGLPRSARSAGLILATSSGATRCPEAPAVASPSGHPRRGGRRRDGGGDRCRGRGRGAALLAGTGIGFGGMLLDSLLGATLQGRFECPRCGSRDREPACTCDTPTRLAGGWRWLDNDGVNALATGWPRWPRRRRAWRIMPIPALSDRSSTC